MQATDVVIAVCFLHIAGSLNYQPPLYPRLSEEPESFVLPRGVNVTLKCRSSGGSVRPTWYCNGTLIRERDGYELLETGDLFIKKFQAGTHEGRYYCKVSVPHDGTVRSRTAVLQRAVIREELLIPPTNLTVYEGNAAFFYCTPNMNIIDINQEQFRSWLQKQKISKSQEGCSNQGLWNKEKCPLQESEELVFLPDNSLFIQNVTSSSPVQFCCTVKKPVCAYLNVLPSKGVRQPPTVALQPKNRTVKEGENIAIPCVVNGVPRPRVDWFKPSGKEVKRNKRHRVHALASNMLMINNASTRDSGVYRCDASNTVGQVTMNVTVIVIGIPRVNYTFNDTIRVQKSRPVEIVCPIVEPHYRKSIKKAIPPFQTTWLKNGSEIKESKDIDILPTTNTLNITDVQFADSGIYQCVVENVYGSNVQTTFHLTPGQYMTSSSAQGPSPVQNLKLTHIPGDVVLSWTPPEHFGCSRTQKCTLRGYLVHVPYSSVGKQKYYYPIDRKTTSINLFGSGVLEVSGEYQFSVQAQNSEDPVWGESWRTASEKLVLPKKNDIDIFRTTSTSVNITYDLPVDDDAYESCTVRVHYSPIANDQSWLSKCLCPCLPNSKSYAKKRQTVTVRGLKPLTAYEFYVEANLESSEMRVKSYLIRCDSGLAAPSEAPKLLQAVRLNSTAFFIDFMGIRPSGMAKFYYQLNYANGTEMIPIVNVSPQNMSETDNSTVRIVIDGSAHGLSAWQDYELGMQSCCNSSSCMGWAEKSRCGWKDANPMPTVLHDLEAMCLMSCNCSGQHSAKVTIRPQDIDFEPVADVKITNVSTESAWIAWQPVNSSLQLVSGYRISVKSEDSMKPSIINDTTSSHLNVTGLQAHTDYSVTVSVLTIDRQSAVAQSEPLRFQTELDLYAAPHNVTIERGHQLNSAVISWKPLFNDKIKVFNVSCCENNQSCIAPKHEVTSNNISIDGLLPLTEYHFRVSAIRGNRQGDWSSCVSYTTPNFTPPPEIRGYCVEPNGIHLTCFVSHCPHQCPPALILSICWSGNLACTQALFDANNSTVKEHNNGTGVTVSVSLSGLNPNLSWDSMGHMAVKYANVEGDKTPTVWSRRIPLTDNSSASMYEQTSCSETDNKDGWSWMVAVVSSVSTVCFVAVVLSIILFLVIRRHKSRSYRATARPDRVSTVSSVGPRHKDSHTYERTRIDGDDDYGDYTELAPEAKRTPEIPRNRVSNQGEVSSGPRRGLYLSNGQPEEEHDSGESRRGYGLLNFHRRSGEEEGEFKEDIPLSELGQPTECVSSSDELESDTSMNIATSSTKRRNGVIVQPHIEIPPQPPPIDLTREDGYSSDVSSCSDKSHDGQNKTTTKYVELHQLWLQEKRKNSKDSKEVPDSKDLQQEPHSKDLQVPQTESVYVQITQSCVSASNEHRRPVSRNSSQSSSQENIHDLFQGMDDDISISDEDFNNKTPWTLSGDYVSGVSTRESSEYVQLASCTSPQQHTPQKIVYTDPDYV